jgi:hypothetical protein
MTHAHSAPTKATAPGRRSQRVIGAPTSLGQNHLTPLDLIATKTGSDLAMRANDGWLAGDRNPKLWTVSLTDGFLECNEAPACRVGTPNGQVPHRNCFDISVGVDRSDGVSPVVGALHW